MQKYKQGFFIIHVVNFLKHKLVKVLIFGGKGLLGKRLSLFLSDNYETFCSSSSSEYYSNFGDGTSVKKIISKIQPNYIINCSAFADVNGCEEDPKKAFLVNSIGVKEISDAITEVDKKIRLIHISTDHFYDSLTPSNEDDVCPKNIYAYSKLLGEKFICNESFVILRTNFFGKSLSSKGSFTDWLFDNLSNNKKLNLFDDILFNPLSIRSIEELIVSIMQSKKNGIYNLGSSSYLSKYEFGMKFCTFLDLDSTLIQKTRSDDLPEYIKKPKSMKMSVKKFEQNFDIILPSLESQIELTSEEYK